MKLKSRLSRTFTAINLATLSVSLLVLFLLVRRDELRDFDEALDAQASEAARFALLRNAVPPGPGAIPEALALSPRYIALYDTNGRLLSANAVLASRAPASLAALGLRDDVSEGRHRVELAVGTDHLRGVTVPLGHDGQVLLYAMPRRFIDQDLAYLLKVSLGLMLSATALTWVVARGVGRHLSREVGAIAEVARKVQKGELSARVEQPMDSDETRDLAEDLGRMIGQLDELMTTQRTFVAHAAHELRSPIATLRGELQLSLRRTRGEEEYRAAIARALQSAELLSLLADDLLTLARVQSRRPIQEARAPFSAVLEGALGLARATAAERSVNVELTVAERAHVDVSGARRDLSRALRNLIDNAVAHSPEGGSVLVDASRDEGAVLVSVQDEGEGVLAAESKHLFTPFWRGHREQSGDTQGAGLGLAIAREIARAHGGEVDLAASPRGTRFVMRLLVAPSPPSATPSGEPSESFEARGEASEASEASGPSHTAMATVTAPEDQARRG